MGRWHAPWRNRSWRWSREERMGRRLVVAAVFFTTATVATGAIGRLAPSALGSLSAGGLATPGAPLIALAPRRPPPPPLEEPPHRPPTLPLPPPRGETVD